MIISKGEIIFVITRRAFDTDLRRHFVGRVEQATPDKARLRGYVFVFDENENDFVRRDPMRTKLIPLGDSGLILNVLPEDIDIKKLHYAKNAQGHRVLTDGGDFSINVNEFGAYR